MRKVAALLLWLSTSGFAQLPTKIESLAWMAGNWVEEKVGARVAETWLGPGNGLMVGVNLSIYPGGKKSFEFLRIVETAEGIVYFASPAGRAPTEFRLKEAGERRAVFERAEDRFPKRVIYRRDGEYLVARIEGTVRGEPKFEEWRLQRQSL